MPPSISVDIWSLLLAAGAIQGLIMAVLLIRTGKRLKANLFLAGLILIIVWVQVEFLMVRSAKEVSWNVFYGMRHGVWLAVGPFYYFYFRNSFQKHAFKPKDYLHWLPFMLFTLCIPAVFAESIPENGMYYGMLSVIRFKPDGLTFIQIFYLFLFFLQYMHAGAYGLICLRRLRLSTGERDTRLNAVRRRWLKAYTVLLLLLVLTAVAYFIVLFYSSFYERWMDYLLVVPLVIATYALAFNAFKRPYLFSNEVTVNFAKEKYEKSALSETAMKALKVELDKLLLEEKIYRHSELRVGDLAEEIGLSTNEISQVINQQYGVNFHQLVNRYRAEEAKEILTDTENAQSVLEIAYQVGFNNKASFNRYFKQYFGKTPSAFRKEIKANM